MTDTQAPGERRRYSRIPFDASAQLDEGTHSHEVRLLDISINGALLELDPQTPLDRGRRYRLSISLSTTATVIMEVRLRHRNGALAGFRCERIDLESLTHLRRLAELNLGDTALLERELAELFGTDS
ncbi:hypothetical protein CAI21_05295 [Alkalilimnicola ehrlichii]|uniref:Cyclic diguanosine monophosphate-binding protein n=1 Tax=Alkalilimnicola ehrlichii TaxID=351052 RepID=A0A3E0X1I7_9GAMM|nr:PilZ domain-containing protein [Alkalilimnicola ehrlichii]RFA30475.1 hypothetical protein CAI21_05295 [Alkalilimnicola ehrlichii]RFA38027.1 hypothetical protein CAL65_06665 [Alkalilimnicola ehrlichii]